VQLVSPERYAQLEASGRLPSPKGVAFAIIKLLQRDDYKISDLVRLVQSDPAIAGRLLKFSNAAAFGHSRPIVSLSKAVIALGAFRVRDLVLGFSVLHGNRSGHCPQFDYGRFWSRALATAISAQALASHAQIAAEENFTAGLLCSVGELALASLFPERYGEIISAGGGVHERLRLEQEAFATDHRELGATLLVEWGLPESLAAAVYHCDMPDEAGFPDGSRSLVLTLSLHFALALAEICVAADTERWIMAPDLFTKAARLGIAPEELTRLADKITASWREWGAMLQIRTREVPPFADLLSSSPPRDPERALPLAYLQHNKTALVVCAEATEAAAITGHLEQNGYSVQSTLNARDGLIVALRGNPDLILLEMSAPELDGRSFCRALRDSSLGRVAYIILIGNRQDEDLLTEGLEAGADDFLLRPITAHTLHARLHAADKVVQLHDEIRRERNDLVRSAGEWAGTHRRLLEVAMTDPLTRLPNRRHGMDFLSAEWVFAHANNLPLACLMIDIDHFKQVNDQFGHDGGDSVLAELASRLKSSSRNEDMVFRYGGEEFCVICPGANQATTRAIAERIRKNMAAERFRHGTQGIAATVSIGLAVMTAAHANGEALIHDADAALYRAKEAGRNRVAS
jgi:two-component system, cell cycle response regulator